MKTIINFRNYDVTITCAVGAGHGTSGHIFEMIEYFYYLRFYHNVNCNIFIPFKFDLNDFYKCVADKYDFTDDEVKIYKDNTYQCDKPRIIDIKTGLFVDGNMYVKNFAGIYKCDKKIFLRCNNNETLDKADIVLQDTRMYDDLKNSTHYVKKILFDKFKKVKNEVQNTAMIYATTNCRRITYEQLEMLSSKYNFEKYIVLSNETFDVPNKFVLKHVPCENLMEKFNTFIYTPLNGSCNRVDCSPRFVAECKYYHKDVIYEIPCFYRGLNVRKYDIENNFDSLFLRKNDDLINFL